MSGELSREQIAYIRFKAEGSGPFDKSAENQDVRSLCDMAESWRAHCEAGRVSVLRIVGTTASCKECPNCRYLSSGYYECDKTEFQFVTPGKPTDIPNWCPLPTYPRC